MLTSLKIELLVLGVKPFLSQAYKKEDRKKKTSLRNVIRPPTGQCVGIIGVWVDALSFRI
jgi:hypothetical protein